MKTFKIEGQAGLILEIVKSLKNDIIGKGIRIMYDIKIERPSYGNNRIIFTAKENQEINPRDFFFLGLNIQW